MVLVPKFNPNFLCVNFTFYFSFFHIFCTNCYTMMLYPSLSLVSLVMQFPSESRLKETQDRVAEQRAAHLILDRLLLSSGMQFDLY